MGKERKEGKGGKGGKGGEPAHKKAGKPPGLPAYRPYGLRF